MRFLIGLCIGIAAAAGPTVLWGGDHVRLDITASGADLDFDCAIGTITQVVPDQDGPFSLKGTFTPQRSGPTRDGASPTVEAIYSGVITGDTMTLRIALRDRDPAGPFVLERGRPGTVRKCR